MDPMNQDIDSMLNEYQKRLSPDMQAKLDSLFAKQTPSAASPVAAPVVAPTPPSFMGKLVNSAQSGGIGMMQGFDNVLYNMQQQMGLNPDPSAQGAQIVDAQRRQGALTTPEDAKAINEIMNSTRTKGQGFLNEAGEFSADVLANPGAFLQLMAQQAPQLIPTLLAQVAGRAGGAAAGSALGPAGAAVGGIVGGGASMGVMSGIMDAGQYVNQYLTDIGIDLNNADEVSKAINNPVILDGLKSEALDHAIPVGILDAVTGSLAGKLSHGIGGLKGQVAEMIPQAAGGALGEYAGQINATGKVNAPDVFLEGLAEAVSAIPEAAIGRKNFQGTSSNEAPGNFGGVEGKFAPVQEEEIQDPATALEGAVPTGPTFTVDAAGNTTAIVQPTAAQATPEASSGQPNPLTTTQLNQKRSGTMTDVPFEEDAKVAQAERMPLGYPKEIVVGSYDRRLNKLKGLPKAELAAHYLKHVGEPGVMTKKDMAAGLLAKFQITPETANSTFPTAPAGLQTPQNVQPNAAIQPEVKPNTLPNNLKTANPRYGYQTSSFNVKFPSDVEKALYIVAQQDKKSAKDSDYRSFLKDTVGMTEQEINDNAAMIKKTLKHRAATEHNSENTADTITAPEAVYASKQTASAPVGVQPSPSVQQPAVEPAKTAAAAKTKLIKQASLPLDVVQSMHPEDAAAMATLQDLGDTFNEANAENMSRDARRTIRNDQQTAMKQLNVTPDLTRVDYSDGKPVTNWKRMSTSWQDFMNRAREIPFLKYVVALSDAKSTMRQQIQDQMLGTWHSLYNQYGKVRMSKAFDILSQLQKTNQTLKVDEQGRLLYRNAEGKMIALDPQTTKAVIDQNETFKASTNVYAIDGRRTLEEEFGAPANATQEDYQKLHDELIAKGTDAHTLNEVEAIVEAITLKEKFDANPNLPYLPRLRNSGRHALGFYTKKDKAKAPTKDNLELRHFATVETARKGDTYDPKSFQEEMTRAEKERTTTWKNEDWYTFDGQPQTAASPFTLSASRLMNELSPYAFNSEIVGSLLTMKGVDPSAVHEVLLAFDNQKDARRLGDRFRESKNITGYNEHAEDVVSSHIGATAANFASHKFNRSIRNTAQGAIRAAENIGDAGNVKRIIDKYTDYTSSPLESWNGIRSFNYAFALAGNPSSAALQLFDMPKNYLSLMRWWGTGNTLNPINMTKALVTLGRSLYKITPNYELLSQPQMKAQFKKLTGLSDTDVNFLYDLKARGALDALLAADFSKKNPVVQYQAQKNAMFGGVPVVGNALNHAKDGAGKMMAFTESASRIMTSLMINRSIQDPAHWAKAQETVASDPYYSAVRDVMNQGKLTKEAFVDMMVKDLHGSYGKEMRPEILRGPIGNVVLPLQTYAFHMADTMWQMVKRHPGGRQAAIAYLAAQFMLFGAQGMPGYDLWDWLFKKYQMIANGRDTDLQTMMSTDVGNAFESLNLDRTYASYLMHGAVYNKLGMDLSARVRPSLPGVGRAFDLGAQIWENKNPEDMFGIVGGVFGGLKPLVNGDPVNVDKMLPAAVRNVKKGVGILNNDVRSGSGKRIMDYNATLPDGTRAFEKGDQYRDAAKQALGFMPQRKAEASRTSLIENRKEFAPLKARFINDLAGAKEDFYKAIAAGDASAQKQAAKDIWTIHQDAISDVTKYAKEDDTLAFDPMTLDKSATEKLVKDAAPYAAGTGVKDQERLIKNEAFTATPSALFDNKKAKDKLKQQNGTR